MRHEESNLSHVYLYALFKSSLRSWGYNYGYQKIGNGHQEGRSKVGTRNILSNKWLELIFMETSPNHSQKNIKYYGITKEVKGL